MATTSQAKTSTKSLAELHKAAPFVIETNVERSRYLKLLVYGDFGVGKTFLAGTSVEVPSMNDILLINAEAGDLTLDSDEYDFDKISSVRVKDFTTMAKVYEYLKSAYRSIINGGDCGVCR